MSALSTTDLATLRSGLSSGLNAQTLQYQVLSSGTAGVATNFTAIVTVQARTEAMDASGHKVEVADIINVRPMAADTLVIGDYILYGGHTYTIRETSGTDIRRLTAAWVPTKGLQRTDRFRAESG